jgi:Xaa-Pro dipeptidase
LTPVSGKSEAELSKQKALRSYRLQRLREKLEAFDMAGIVLLDPVNIRYANGSSNMQVWT